MDKIKIKYKFSDDYNPKYVNGAYGGINSKGELVINFFLERPAIPKSQTFEVEDGLIQKEIIEDREPNDHGHSLIRYVDSGIVLSKEHAVEIYDWLTKFIDLIKEKKNE